MTSKEIITYPSPILNKMAVPVMVADSSINKLIRDMADTLYSTTGIGLAAPQIGSNKRVIIYDPYREDGKGNYKVLINPQITATEGEAVSEEGCKSLPGLRINVKRAAKIQVAGLDVDGNSICFESESLESIVLQHEIDHLNGTLLIDHVHESEKALYQWYAKNLSSIFNRIKWLEKKEDGIIHQRRVSDQNIVVIKSDSQIQLYFASVKTDARLHLSGIMSRIDLNDPIILLGIYTQAMMVTLLWKSNPKKIYMLGFGGGRIPMIFYHYFPEVVIDSSEIDPHVVELSQRYFGINIDKRLSVTIKEGREHLTNSPDNIQYDIILVDCYTDVGHHPYELSTIEFYNLCKTRLTSGGVIATNLVESDPLFSKKATTFHASFAYSYDFVHEGAHVFFGSDVKIDDADIIKRAAEIDARCKFHFPFLERAGQIKLVMSNLSFDKNNLLNDNANPSKSGNSKTLTFRGVGRNERCPCGSGKKFKMCHGQQSKK